MNFSRIILPLLAIVAAASGYYAWQNSPSMQSVSGEKVGGAVTANTNGQNILDSGQLNLSGGEQRKFHNPRRNLFGQLFPPPPAPKKVVLAPVVQPDPVVVAAPLPTSMPVPVRNTVSQMPSFQVLGFLEKDDQMTAFLSLQGEIYLVKKDQLFADEFRISEISPKKMTIARASGAGEVTLPLGEKNSTATIPFGSSVSSGRSSGPSGSSGRSSYRPSQPASQQTFKVSQPSAGSASQQTFKVTQPSAGPGTPVKSPVRLPAIQLTLPPAGGGN